MFLFNVNRLLLPIKAHYFLWNCGTAPVTPFLSVYTKYLGFSSFVTGIIFTVLPITGLLGKPLVGWIADKFKCQRRLFSSSIVLTGVTFIAILYVPKIEHEAECRHERFKDYLASSNHTGIYWYGDNGFNSTSCKDMCIYHTNSEHNGINNTQEWSAREFISFTPSAFISEDVNCLQAYRIVENDGIIGSNDTYLICGKDCDLKSFQENSSGKSVYADYPFWIFLILMMLAWLGQAIVVSVSDSICFELLADKPNQYGRQRCFGSLGWGIFSIFAGMILDTGTEEDKNYTAGFYFAAGILLLDFVASLSLKYEQKISSSHIIRDVAELVKNPTTVIFIIICIFMGVCTGLIWNFLFWLVEEITVDKEWVKTLEGVIMGIQCLGGELPLFFTSGWILKRLGHINTTSMILFTLGIRFILYSVITNPWYLLPVELLNGITFGLFYACMTSYASIVAPPGTGTTVQGTVGALFEFGVALGSFIAGLLIETYGGPLTFRLFGYAALFVGLLHVVVQCFFKDKPVKSSNELV